MCVLALVCCVLWVHLFPPSVFHCWNNNLLLDAECNRPCIVGPKQTHCWYVFHPPQGKIPVLRAADPLGGSLLSGNPMTDFMGQIFASSNTAEKWIGVLWSWWIKGFGPMNGVIYPWRAARVPSPITTVTKVQPVALKHPQLSGLQTTALQHLI